MVCCCSTLLSSLPSHKPCEPKFASSFKLIGGSAFMLKDAHFNIMATNSAQDKSQNEKGFSTTRYEKFYLTTAMREFKLTKWQIECALSDGVLQQRDEVEFFCETCQTAIRAPNGYPPFEWYCQGKIPQERALKLLQRHHIRHWHTSFDEVYKTKSPP
jgi:hypothetical protein